MPHPNLREYSPPIFQSHEDFAFKASFERLQEFAASEGRCAEFTDKWLVYMRHVPRHASVWPYCESFLRERAKAEIPLFWEALLGMLLEEHMRYIEIQERVAAEQNRMMREMAQMLDTMQAIRFTVSPEFVSAWMGRESSGMRAEKKARKNKKKRAKSRVGGR